MKFIRNVTMAAVLGGVLLFLTVACSGVISRETRAQVDSGMTLSGLAADADQTLGRMVMFSGIVIDVNRTGDTVLTIQERPGDYRGRPLRVDVSGGRFLAEVPLGMDTGSIRPGQPVTVAGVFKGLAEDTRGRKPRAVPVIRVAEIHVWEPWLFDRVNFRFSFGTQL